MNIVIIHVDGHELSSNETSAGIDLRNLFKKCVKDIIRVYYGPTFVQYLIGLSKFNDGTKAPVDANLDDDNDDDNDSDATVKDKEEKGRKRKQETASLTPDGAPSKLPRTDP